MILRKCKEVVVDLLLGGNGQIDLNLAALVPNLRQDYTEKLTLSFDVSEEFDHLPNELPENTYIFPLGEAETAQSVAIKPKLKRTLAKRKGSPAKDGSSQLRGVGNDNFQQEEACLEEFINRKVIPTLYRLSGGSLTHAHVRVFCSINGGMGGGAANRVVRKIGTALRKRTSAVVQTSFYLTGAQSYLDCGPGIIPNSGACLDDVVSWIIDPQRDPKEVRGATLFELPQENTERRVEWIGLIHQALKSNAYSRILNPLLSNVTADNDPYHVQLLRIAGYHHLDVWQDVAPTIAADYCETLGRLSGLAERKYSTAIDKLQISISRIYVARPDVNALVKTLTQTVIDPDEFITLVKTPGTLYDITINGVILPAGLLNLTNAQTTFALPPITTQQIVERQEQFVAALSLLDRERRVLEIELAERLREQAKHESSLRSNLRLLNPNTSWKQAQSWLSGNGVVMAAIADSIVNLRAAFDAAWLTVSELNAVKKTTTAVETEQRQLNTKLAGMRSLLSELCYRDGGQTYVTAKPLDDVLTTLWQCDDQTSKAVIQQILLHAVAVVTHEGLAKCLGCRDARIETLSQALIDGNYSDVCPPWGGDARQRTDMLLHALPPLAPTLFEQLQTYVVQRVRDRRLFMVDRLAAGISVLDLHRTSVNARAEIFTDFYQDALATAKSAKNPELYFPDGLPE